MKENADLVLTGPRVALVPYRPEHVGRYHAWMSDPDLLAATASEPLTLAEETANQVSWSTDPDKLTFVVVEASSGKMLGDVNAFWTIPDDPTAAEIELMIAEPGHRGKGLGREALLVFMWWLATGLKSKPAPTRFVAKIGLGNTSSRALFEGALGFGQVSLSEVFAEVTLDWPLSSADFSGWSVLSGPHALPSPNPGSTRAKWLADAVGSLVTAASYASSPYASSAEPPEPPEPGDG